MAKKSSKETTNLPLVISLVFFVLTTIGFGVMWYMAYSEQEKFVADKKKAEDDLKNARTITADSERVARVYRIMMGVDDPDDKEKLKSESKAGDKASLELKKINEALVKKVAGGSGETPAAPFAIWLPEADGSIGTMPATGLVDVAVDANNKKAAAEAAQAKATASYQTAVTNLGAASDALQKARDLFTASAKTLPEDFKRKMDDLDKAYTTRAKVFATAEEETRKLLETNADKLTKNERETKLLKEKTEFQRIEISELVAQMNSKEDKAKLEVPLGRILNRHTDGTIEIDIGSDALVKPGLKFTVLPSDYPQKGERSRMFVERSADVLGTFRGKEQWRQKANIEVVEVRGPNLSICRLVPMDAGLSTNGTPLKRLEYDDIRDRVMKGDLIYHPYWKKGTADHVALVGIFDTNGDGVDDIESVVRDLRATGIPVDAYFDLRTGKWNEGGKLTPRTRSLIIGELPINSGTDPNRDAKSALTAKLEGAIKEAKEKGIRAENYREVFPKMGYYVRVPLPDEKINQATARYLNAPPPETPPGPGN
jgi:hypothetical protein